MVWLKVFFLLATVLIVFQSPIAWCVRKCLGRRAVSLAGEGPFERFIPRDGSLSMGEAVPNREWNASYWNPGSHYNYLDDEPRSAGGYRMD